MRNYRGFYGDLLGSQCFYYFSISSSNMHTLCSFIYIYIYIYSIHKNLEYIHYVHTTGNCLYLYIYIYIYVVSSQVDERP